MKTIKPQRLGILSRTFETGDRPTFVPSILAFFPLEAPAQLLPEVAMWKFLATQMGKDIPIDLGMNKQRGELLVDGSAYPRGGARPVCAVRVTLGSIDKELYVVGHRRWGTSGPTEPEPFEEMPITWENAYGGEGVPANPVGKGAAPIMVDGRQVQPLPNIEQPGKLITSPRQKAEPVGLSAVDPSWPSRMKMLGTYDDEWLQTRFPGYAKDIDWGYFNLAPRDQQIDGFFRGDERLRLEHLHPDKPVIESSLPGISTRCFVTLRTPAGDQRQEIPMRLDTVRLFPRAMRGVLVFRGAVPVEEDDGADVAHVLIAAERMGQPQPASHYAKVLEQRLDKKTGALYALRDRDLMPPPPDDPLPLEEEDWNDTKHLVETEGLFEANARRGMEASLEQARAEAVKFGHDADKVPKELPPPAEVPSLEELPELVERLEEERAVATAAAEEQRVAAETAARLRFTEQGLDYDAMVAEARARGGGPPPFSAAEEIARLEDLVQLGRNADRPFLELEAKLADAAFVRSLHEAEEKLRLAYRRFTQYMPEAVAGDPEASARVRARIDAGRAGGESLQGIDLTGAHLEGIDLAGRDLREAMLEGADLRGANLTGADLSGATLCRANLEGAILRGANVSETNLSLSRLAQIDAREVVFADTNLSRADLSGAQLHGASLKGAILSEAILAGADMSGLVAAERTVFLKVDFSRLSLAGANLTECMFVECAFVETDLSDAILEKITVFTARGERSNFRRARAKGMRLVAQCAFADSDFSGADLEMANLRGTVLTNARFDGAHLASADLSECDLQNASLYRAIAPNARFSKADLRGANLVASNLMMALLDKAKLIRADLRGANLFRADLAKIRADKTTNLEGAFIKEVRVVPLRAHEQG